MGGTPRFCLVSLALPSSKTGRWVESFYRGLLKLARRTRTPLAGGDFARDDKVRCDVTVCGAVKHGKALRRDSARPADLLYVSGRLGKFWDRPIRPRLDLGRKLIGKATACIDLSDGISLDLHRLCKASGVAAEIERIPVAKGASLERALHGGEDYELLFTCPDGTPPPGGTYRIGRITAGVPGKVQFEGRRLLASGYDHFSHSDF
jgi:thiamine-monophosphate kinase